MPTSNKLLVIIDEFYKSFNASFHCLHKLEHKNIDENVFEKHFDAYFNCLKAYVSKMSITTFIILWHKISLMVPRLNSKIAVARCSKKFLVEQ